MSLILNVVCNVQHKFDKAQAFKGVQGTAGGIDLMIMDVLEGLPVPMVSYLLISIPDWNSEDENFMAMVFDMESSFVYDNGVLVLFHKDDLKLKANIRGSAKGLPLQDLEGMDRYQPFASDQCHRCIKDNKWFQPCHLHHSFLYICISNLYVANCMPYYIHL